MQAHTTLPSNIIPFITSTIISHNLKKPILQLPKSLLPHSFWLVSSIRKQVPADTQIYVLYDSMKKQCSRHIGDYDGLLHIGYACFSEGEGGANGRCWYVMPEGEWTGGECRLKEKELMDEIRDKGIDLVLVDQALYRTVMGVREQIEKETGAEIARLPFDRRQGDRYFGFGYYCGSHTKTTSVLVMRPDTTQNTDPTSQLLLQNLYLSKKSLNISTLHSLTPTTPLSPFTPASQKRLLQRLSQISQLSKHTTFGILVSNPSTRFCQQQIQRCRKLLDGAGMKHFTFMMNNLNQCKLGNFPEIQVYVVIACYNYSLYGVKDFYRLVVVPYDLEVAFGEASYEDYRFDLSTPCTKDNKQQQKKQQDKKQQQNISNEGPKQIGSSLAKINNKLSVEHMMQTLDFYQSREYKGLEFKEKKEVEKIKLGKVGIATQYARLEDELKQ